jgi:hypothetical protein
MINSNHVKRGMALKVDNDLVVIQSFEHHKPGKGAAIVRVRIKSLSKGTMIPPNFVVVKVDYAEEGMKGDTATTAYKEVTVVGGGKIQTPLFVKTGDMIKVDLRDLSYVERVTQK